MKTKYLATILWLGLQVSSAATHRLSASPFPWISDSDPSTGIHRWTYELIPETRSFITRVDFRLSNSGIFTDFGLSVGMRRYFIWEDKGPFVSLLGAWRRSAFLPGYKNLVGTPFVGGLQWQWKYLSGFLDMGLGPALRLVPSFTGTEPGFGVIGFATLAIGVSFGDEGFPNAH